MRAPNELVGQETGLRNLLRFSFDSFSMKADCERLLRAEWARQGCKVLLTKKIRSHVLVAADCLLCFDFSVFCLVTQNG